MSPTPEPRPALQRAEDGAVHPAAPRATPPKHLHPAPPAPAAATPPNVVTGPFKPGDLRARKAVGKEGKDATKGKASTKGERAPLNVDVPKKLRKAVRRQAESESRSVDELVTDALMDYLER